MRPQVRVVVADEDFKPGDGPPAPPAPPAPPVAAPVPASVPPDGALVDKNELRWVVDILQAGAVDGALVLVGLDG